MPLLTSHGTLVCLREGGGGLAHLPLPLTERGVVPLDVEAGEVTVEGVKQMHPALGFITLRPAPAGQGITLMRYGRFLCAERTVTQMAFDRMQAAIWESFLPVSWPDLDGLQRLVSNRWIVAPTRQVLRRADIGVAPGFALRLGAEHLLLAECLPLTPTASDGAAAGGFRIEASGRRIELILAEPRSSALLRTNRWPVRARRIAEIMTLAVHRQLSGREPEQAVFDEDAAFLLDRDGPAGLEDLMERVAGRLPAAAVPQAARTWPQIAQPIVPLGTACIAACLLRRMDLEQPPMPFDWLSTTPAMIRHCLETDFSVLLDRSHYRSLTGLARPGEPEHGCAHEFYAREHGIARVFNHNDPTRDADYRYTQACVDRLRDLLASDGPKMFLQIRETHPDIRQDFETTCALLDGLTRNASLVTIAVAQPDRRLAMPVGTVVVREGAHTLYRLQSTSQLGGEDFMVAADRDFVIGLIAAHAARPARTRLAVPGDRANMQAGMERFGVRPARPLPEGEAGRLAILDQANQALHRFLERIGLPRRYRFGNLDAAKLPSQQSAEACIVQMVGQQTLLRLDMSRQNSWVLLYRSLPLVYVLDLALADGPCPDTRFLGEFGDAGYEPRSATFCTEKPGSCLLPDPDFCETGGYDAFRRQLAANPTGWDARRDAVFWRGSSTGQRRHDPPPQGEDDDFTWLPRLDLCRRTRISPLAKHFDVGISNICQIEDPYLAAHIAEAGLTKPPVSRAGFLGHKGILVIDGNTNAWSALFCGLLTGACVFKVESPRGYRQWYYDRLVPWVNFVPISEDLHDLDDRVAWLLSHDHEARAIGEAGQALAMELTFETVMQDAGLRLRTWLTGKA